MNKRILFLHGLESKRANPIKMDYLRDFYNATVLGPTFNYKEKPKYSEIRKICQEFKPDIILGSSMGGRQAFFLSNEFKIPTLLFNPAIQSDLAGKFQPVPHDYSVYKKQYIALGKTDKVVDPYITKNIADKNGLYYKFWDTGHRFDFNLYKKVIDEYISKF